MTVAMSILVLFLSDINFSRACSTKSTLFAGYDRIICKWTFHSTTYTQIDILLQKYYKIYLNFWDLILQLKYKYLLRVVSQGIVWAIECAKEKN